ncbi:MAG: hypothetical protein JXA82_00740 [Sedimentisphaerales bacterium]|nr:hypothetical protein [Sedimentisphaerales bacterium]
MDMRDMIHNRNFYFVLIPVLAGGWLMFSIAVSVSSAKTWTDEQAEWNMVRDRLHTILTLDPSRRSYQESNTTTEEFDYANVIDTLARAHSIPTSVYRISSKPPIIKDKKKMQTADLTIDTINIQKLSSFLTRILTNWPDLNCDTLTLTKVANSKDAWKVYIKFSYTYD